MSSTIPQSSIQGSLFELVARGKKDSYFIKDDEDSTFIFNGRYDSSAPFLKERRTTVPLNQPLFGNTFEVELDTYGDILTECNLLIQLPSWLPPLPTDISGFGAVPTDPIRANWLYWITDTSGYSYGYTNYIGYFLFEKIQFYQDQILLQEWSGDGLFATTASVGSWNSAYLSSAVLGGANDTVRGIALRATPGLLRLTIPLPGMQTDGEGGLPLCCLPAQNYRFRIRLRPLEDLVVSDRPMGLCGTDGTSTTCYGKPAPWLVDQFQYTLPGSATPYTFSPVARELIGQPTILLETVQAYVPSQISSRLQTTLIQIPFRRQFENIFTFGENDYKPLDHGGVAQVTRRIDGRHPTERIVFFFRTADAINTNRLSDLIDPSGYEGQFYNEMKLVIAGRDREHLFPPSVWQDVESFAKDEIDTGYTIGEMNWSLGDVYSRLRPYSNRVPEGTVNFTTADRPTLHINLTNVPPEKGTNLRNTEMRVFTEGWDVYEIQEGRGRMLFAN